MPYCTNCGAEENEGQRFCAQCGTLTQQEAPVLSIPEEGKVGIPLAGFWWRVLGWLIDSLILLVPLFAISRIAHSYWVAKGIGVSVTLLYATLFIGLRERTPGMAVVNLRCVTRESGGVAGVNRALVRAAYVAIGSSFVTIFHPYTFRPAVTQAQKNHNAVVGAVTILLTLPMILSYLWAAWDKRRQTLYDKVAGTVVTREVVMPAKPRGDGMITFESTS